MILEWTDMSELSVRAPTYPLRLPASIKREAERLAAADGASFSQFVIAEKVGAMRTAAYFRSRALSPIAGDRLLARKGSDK